MTIKNIKKYFFENYHRPTAKFQHFLSLIKKITLNSNSNYFAERVMLLKTPPKSMLYFNYFGRILFFTKNLISILLCKKFFEIDLKIENNFENLTEIPTEGSDNQPWPNQAMHYFEKEKDTSDDFIENIQEDYLLTFEVIVNFLPIWTAVVIHSPNHDLKIIVV